MLLCRKWTQSHFWKNRPGFRGFSFGPIWDGTRNPAAFFQSIPHRRGSTRTCACGGTEKETDPVSILLLALENTDIPSESIQFCSRQPAAWLFWKISLLTYKEPNWFLFVLQLFRHSINNGICRTYNRRVRNCLYKHKMVR